MVTAIAMVAAASTAHATTAEYMPTVEVARAASVVLRGRVESRRSGWEGDLIVTHVRIEVVECWAGECRERRITVRELGGEIDGIGLLPLEPTQLAVGREVVLFARSRGAVLEAVAGNQGVFAIDAATELATRRLDSVDLSGIREAVERVVSLRALRRIVRESTATFEEGNHHAF